MGGNGARTRSLLSNAEVATDRRSLYPSRLDRSNCDLPVECVPLRLNLRPRILSGHSLTQRTETAICLSPWDCHTWLQFCREHNATATPDSARYGMATDRRKVSGGTPSGEGGILAPRHKGDCWLDGHSPSEQGRVVNCSRSPIVGPKLIRGGAVKIE